MKSRSKAVVGAREAEREEGGGMGVFIPFQPTSCELPIALLERFSVESESEVLSEA